MFINWKHPVSHTIKKNIYRVMFVVKEIVREKIRKNLIGDSREYVAHYKKGDISKKI